MTKEELRAIEKNFKGCPHCRTIRDMLKPTMKTKRHDSIVVMFSADALERIYANAKKGAK